MLTMTQLHKGDKQCVIVNAEAKTKPQKMRSPKTIIRDKNSNSGK